MILVLAEDYPSEKNKYAMSYVHTRNLYYQECGLDVMVINFKANSPYNYEGIDVLPFSYYNNNPKEIDLLISHAPNLKSHLKFIRMHFKRFKNVIMVFHGHETLKVSKYYPKPYPFMKKSISSLIIRNLYDAIKLKALKFYIKKINKQKNLKLIFVSEWMKNESSKNLNLNFEGYNIDCSVIHNNAHEIFIEQSYVYEKTENYSDIGDFITIRPFNDPKYGIDLVHKLALKNPNFKFDVYGKGEYFKYNKPPENLRVFNKFFSHKELPKVLNKYKGAMMPTRLDAQGVMMCEMATYGIPLITSEIYICKEMLKDFENSHFFNNDLLEIDLNEILTKKSNCSDKNLKFSSDNTVSKEVEIIQAFIKGD